MIELRDISKVYHVGESEVRALDHVSMHVDDGEFVAIIGPSGSGKSTMMNIIGCLDTADGGAYLLDGQTIENYTEAQITRIRGEKIGFIFQGFNLIGTMSAYENVELPLLYQRIGKKERAQRATEALEKVGLASRAQHKPSELSGGQQQRVAIARAIATRPSLFLADEPTGNLDSKTGAEIMDMFSHLHEFGSTIVLITHDDKIAARASRSVRVLDGHIVEGGDATAPLSVELESDTIVSRPAMESIEQTDSIFESNKQVDA